MNETGMEKARRAKSAEELLEIARAEGVAMSLEEAKQGFANLHKPSGELSDEELDAVAGGGCYSDDGHLMTTIGYGCDHYEADASGMGVDGTCCRCKYWKMSAASQLIVFGQPAPCMHPKNNRK